MKKNKIVGLGISLLGLTLSLATAFALYSQVADPIGMNIGAGEISVVTTSDKLVYRAGTATVTYANTFGEGKQTSSKFDSTHNEIEILLPLSATYPTSGVIAQDAAIGKLSLTVTPNAALTTNVGFEMAAYVNGYAQNNYFATADSVKFTPTQNATFYKGEPFSGSIHVPVKSSLSSTVLSTENSNYLRIWMRVTNVTVAEALAANESLFSISVDWGTPDNSYEMAYIAGYQTNWKTYSDYRMVPNLDANVNSYQWKFQGLGVGGFKPYKIATSSLVDGKNVSEYASGVVKWASGDDRYNDTANATVYWDGTLAQ